MGRRTIIKGLYEAHLPVSNLANLIEFYKKLDLEIAYQNDTLAFFCIVKGHSWLGLWETDKVETPYHPSLRHIALHVDIEDIQTAKEWLEQKGIQVRSSFGFPPEKQPLVLPNNPNVIKGLFRNVCCFWRCTLNRSFPPQARSDRGGKSSLLDVPSAGSRLFLYNPQESSAFRSNPLCVSNVIKSNKLLVNSLI
ncbi:VOC family protein [Bacillus sp. FJAT-29937]|uniref:VOC family protein n=1 Tax=Bacillus sp. FJAT-29937 TaxID=1720553 RepID=UPI0008325DC2